MHTGTSASTFCNFIATVIEIWKSNAFHYISRLFVRYWVISDLRKESNICPTLSVSDGKIEIKYPFFVHVDGYKGDAGFSLIEVFALALCKVETYYLVSFFQSHAGCR